MIRWAVTAALLAAAVGDDFSSSLQRAIEETRKGEFANAAVDLQAALQSDPQSPEVHFRQGLLLARLSDFPGAEKAFRKAVELRPSFAEAHYNLGLVQIANPQAKLDWPAAIRSFQTALQYRPDYPEAFNSLGAGLMATGDVDGALAQWQQALQLNPAFAESHFNLGVAQEAKDRFDEAEAQYRAAIAARPNYPEALIALGKLLCSRSRLPEAEQQLKAALRLNPDLSNAHYVLAQLKKSQKEDAAARLELEQVHDLSQRKSDVLLASRITNEGLQSAAKGEMAPALAAERQAVSLKPDFGIAHYNLALLLADSGDWNGAADELVKAASLMPGNAAPWFNLGRVLQRTKDASGAQAALLWAHRLAPSDARIKAELTGLVSKGAAAGVLPESGPPESARPPFGPTADTAAEHLAFALRLSSAGDHLGATGELLRVLAIDPADAKSRTLLVDEYRRLKRSAQAVLEQAKLEFTSRPDSR